MTAGAVISHKDFLAHGSSAHVERPERLQAIEAALVASPLRERLSFLEPRPATDAEIERVHPNGYVREIEAFCDHGAGWIDADTLLTPDSARVARLAAGGAARAVEAVVREGIPWVFSLCRPPGHHATPQHSMGFCVVNNAAVAARHARQALGLRRVAVIDWDVHHGNGTQDIFYDDPTVLYFSVHQHPLYPGTGKVSDRGVGTTVNVPLPAGMGDDDYGFVFEDVLAPAVRAFAPELIVVSAGFDAHERDPLGGMRITSKGFGRLADQVRRLAEETPAQGRMVAVLEGGYDLQGLSESVVAVIERWSADRPVAADALHVEPDRVHAPVRKITGALHALGVPGAA